MSEKAVVAVPVAMFDLLKGVGLAFALRAAGACLAFLLNVAIGRLLGASGAGLYFLALSVVSIASVVARLGFESTVLRFVAADADGGEWGHARGVLRHALGWSGAVSAGFSLVIVAGAPLIASWVFDAPELTPALVAIGFSVLGYNVMILVGEALKGVSRVRDSMLVNGVFYPLIALALLWPAIRLFGPAGAGLAYFGGTALAAGLGLALWRRALVGRPGPAPVDSREMWASSRPLWVSMIIIRAIQPWAPLFLLGIWADSASAGIFGAATRVALLVSFFLIAINTVLAPRFAALHKQGDFVMISRRARQFALFVTLAASPAFLVFIFAGDWVMGLFGPGFASSGHVLAILAIGQAVNAFTGPVGVVLTMGGRERDMRTLSLVSVIVLLGVSFALIPTMNLTGAALATSSAYVVTSIMAVALVRMRFGVWVVPFMPRAEASEGIHQT